MYSQKRRVYTRLHLLDPLKNPATYFGIEPGLDGVAPTRQGAYTLLSRCMGRNKPW